MRKQIFIRVFSQPIYITIALLSSVVLYSILVLLFNIDLSFSVILSDTITLWQKIVLHLNILYGASHVFHPINFLTTILLAMVFGIYISLFIYWVRISRSISTKTAGGGMLGAILGFLGMGCSVCGTLVIAPFLTLVGAGGLLTALPLQGGELSIVALLWMIFSVYLLLTTLSRPIVCPIE